MMCYSSQTSLGAIYRTGWRASTDGLAEDRTWLRVPGGQVDSQPTLIGRKPVHTPSKRAGVWPTPQQELLLRAALLHSREAINAWECWTATVDFESIDLASQRLLPLAYHNLRALGVTELGIDRVKGIYRRTWYSNQILFRRVAVVLRAFHAAGLQTMLLKGTALVLRFYEDSGLRPMNDCDVLVRPEQATEAVRVLAGLGWRTKWRPIETFKEPLFSTINGHEFLDPDWRMLDLHWHVLPQCGYAGADDDFWDGAEAVQFQGELTTVLNAEDTLLHVCLHGLVWNPESLVRWIADAMMILDIRQGELDWERLVSQARKRLLLLPLRDALHYLREALDAPIPDGLLRTMRALPVSALERLEHRIRLSPRWGLGGMPLHFFHYWRYARLSKDSTSGHGPIGLLAFLQQVWGLRRPSQVPAYVMGEGLRRAWIVARALVRPASERQAGAAINPAGED